MRSSNPIALTLTLLSAAALVLAYLWTHRIPEAVRLWATLAGLIGCCIGGFYLWRHGVAVRFILADIPTSSIATAAQGYVELAGTACAAEDITGKKNPLDYLWKRSEFAERASWANMRMFPFNLFYLPVSTEVTEEPFAIRDATGTAVILPHGAEVICADRQVFYDDDRRRIDEHIREGEPLYLLGWLMTHQQATDIDAEVERMLADWKLDAAIRARFDTNRDGYLSGKELIEMHRAARTAVSSVRQEATAAQLHTILRPGEGQRFVISTLTPDQLAGHYQWHLAGGLALFFAGLVGTVILYVSRLA